MQAFFYWERPIGKCVEKTSIKELTFDSKKICCESDFGKYYFQNQSCFGLMQKDISIPIK